MRVEVFKKVIFLCEVILVCKEFNVVYRSKDRKSIPLLFFFLFVVYCLEQIYLKTLS